MRFASEGLFASFPCVTIFVEILVVHQEVYDRCASLAAYVESEIKAEAVRGYACIDDQLQNVDSGTNARLIEAMERNLDKTMACAQILHRLLSFIDSATREMEEEDRQMAQNIDSREREDEDNG